MTIGHPIFLYKVTKNNIFLKEYSDSSSKKIEVEIIKMIKLLCKFFFFNFGKEVGFSLFWHFRIVIFNVWNQFVLAEITDEGSLPEIPSLSLLLIKSDLKCCIHLSRSPFLYCNFLVSVSESPRAHTRVVRKIRRHSIYSSKSFQ